jgi:hypothetical protein
MCSSVVEPAFGGGKGRGGVRRGRVVVVVVRRKMRGHGQASKA